MKPVWRSRAPCVTRGRAAGRQPEVPPGGKRQGYTVFEAIAYCSGRLFAPGIEGRLNSESSHGCWHMIMEQTTQPLLLIHDGARYHPSAAPKRFWPPIA